MRQEVFAYYKENPSPSVLIIGAGVNGIGTFRDLALQGVDVLLVDKGDFCSGASAASSHMAHGGIRYLENGEFRLVREAVRERNRLIQNAPHYVKPLPTVIPIFKWFSGLFNAPFKFLGWLDKPAERGAVIIKIGLMLYDAYTGGQSTVPRHRFFPRRAALEQFPRLNPRVKFIARYYDGAMHAPERICIEMVLDAEAANPRAHALNYLALESAAGDAVTLRDRLSGETVTVRPRLVINAAGPWIDFANARMGLPTRFIGGTKGSHLILDNPELRQAIGDHEFFFENKDGRIVLIYPLEDKVMIGTSDIPIEDPEQARCTEEEIAYFFDMIPVVFPDIAIRREQIVFQFSGVRPLPASDVDNPGQISRDHSLRVTEAGEGLAFPVFSLVGGKWTSFRAFSEEVTDKALAFLGRERRVSTRELAIGGGRDYPHEPEARQAFLDAVCAQSGLPRQRVGELFERYGTRTRPLTAFLAQGADAPLDCVPGFSRREVAYLAQTEKVVHLEDFILRRSTLAKLGNLSAEGLHEIAGVLAAVLGWSTGETEAEIERAADVLREKHGVQL